MSKKVVTKKFIKKKFAGETDLGTYSGYGLCFMKEMEFCILKAGPEARHRAVSTPE